jgi:DNA-binding transcriptional ArsR family regulator
VTGRRALSAPAHRTAKADGPANDSEHASGRWTFLTNHAHVLLLLARNPSMVLREVATLVKITERAVQRIIADLEGEGFIEREKVGRQNHYRIISGRKLKHAVEGHRTIGDLLRIIDDGR